MLSNISDVDRQISSLNYSLKLEVEALKNLTDKLNKINIAQANDILNDEFLRLEKSLSKKATLSQLTSEKEFLKELTLLVTQSLALNAIDERIEHLTKIESELKDTTSDYSTLVSTLKNLLDKKLQVQNETLKLENEINLKN